MLREKSNMNMKKRAKILFCYYSILYVIDEKTIIIKIHIDDLIYESRDRILCTD